MISEIKLNCELVLARKEIAELKAKNEAENKSHRVTTLLLGKQNTEIADLKEISKSWRELTLKNEQAIIDGKHEIIQQAAHIERWVKFIHGNWKGNFTPELKRLLKSTPKQSLAIIQADAIERALKIYRNPETTEWQNMEFEEFLDSYYLAQLRGKQ